MSGALPTRPAGSSARPNASTTRGFELSAGAAAELGERVAMLQGAPVGALGRHRRVGVADRDHARGQRDLLGGETVGVALAVPALVRRTDDVADLLEGRRGGEDPLAD